MVPALLYNGPTAHSARPSRITLREDRCGRLSAVYRHRVLLRVRQLGVPDISVSTTARSHHLVPHEFVLGLLLLDLAHDQLPDKLHVFLIPALSAGEETRAYIVVTDASSCFLKRQRKPPSIVPVTHS
jgi:hypothetical protein